MSEDGANSSRKDGRVVFVARLGGSEAFRPLFQEGMALVEETADYLDGEGRRDSRRLSRAGSLVYATESMRLTTRLMQLASWLLLQRAVNDGELTHDQARLEKSKVKLNGLSTATEGPGWDALPERLRGLIARSIKLQERIRRLDAAFEAAAPSPADNPVMQQIGRIAEAFKAVRG